MANIQLSKEQILKKKFIFAFPGMGKTPFVQSHSGYVDADFGFYRESFLVNKESEACLFKPYARLIRLLAAEGYKIFINEPQIMRFVNPKESVVLLPVVSKYSAEKLGESEAVVDGWIQGWNHSAEKLGIPVVWINIGLDAFLK